MKILASLPKLGQLFTFSRFWWTDRRLRATKYDWNTAGSVFVFSASYYTYLFCILELLIADSEFSYIYTMYL